MDYGGYCAWRSGPWRGTATGAGPVSLRPWSLVAGCGADTGEADRGGADRGRDRTGAHTRTGAQRAGAQQRARAQRTVCGEADSLWRSGQCVSGEADVGG